MNKLFKQAAVASLLAMTMSSAMAVSTSAVTGQWSLTLYSGTNLTPQAKQGICFKSDGTWYSTSFGGWNGDWLLKGDRLRWYGDTGSVATAEFGQFISNTSMGGEFAHFRVPGTPPITSSRGNYLMTKVSSACSAAPTGLQSTLESQGSGDPAAP